jgi:arginase family enzyme
MSSQNDPSSVGLFGAQEGESGEVIAFGVVYDQGSAGSFGCAQAPSMLRRLTRESRIEDGLWDYAERRRLPPGRPMSDAGDFRYTPAMPRDQFFGSIEAKVHDWALEGRLPLGLGGDHSITLPIASGVAKALGQIQILQLDAHHDYAERREGYGPTHSNFMSFLLEVPQVARLVQVGVRGVSAHLPAQPDKAIEATIENLDEALLPDTPVYLTIDTDAFDPALAPAVTHPIPGGLRWEDLHPIATATLARGRRLVGLDWTEYNPTLEGRNAATGVAISHALGRLLSTMAERARATA